MKKLNTTIEECGCERCGTAGTYTYEKEVLHYPDVTQTKFYEVRWLVQFIKRGAEAITKDGYFVSEFKRKEITSREFTLSAN
tara:strand:- start:394 stop:639 length:246 start_codon:yes stop_codon:yes gene_type:complete